MSFQVYLIFEVFLVVFISFSKNVEAAYENNPFFHGDNKPVSPPNQLPATHPPVTQPPVIVPSYQQSTTTKEPTFTIEPPEILYGHDLNKKCLKPRGQFPSNSCNKYINCWDGVAIEQLCLGNYLFNSVKLYCDFPENVDCQGRPITRASASTVIPGDVISTTSSVLNPTQSVTQNSQSSVTVGTHPSLRKFCLRSTGLFPGSTCSKFVNCWNDNAVEQDCPPGLYFNSEGYCDYPGNVFCGDQNNNEVIPARLEEIKSDCPLEFGNFRNRNDCSKYYTCAFYKVAAKYSCPEGFSFSDLLGICDYSYRVDCSKEPQIYQKKFNNNLQVIQTKDSNCPLEFGNFRNITACNQYYTCAFYKITAKYDCPTGFSFSDLLGICDYSYRVDCTKEPQIYQKNSNYMQGYEFPFNAFAHPDLAIAPSESPCTVKNGVVRDKENCSSYYVCESGNVVANYVCPDGFKFSNELGVCDYEEKVDCNSPIKPQEVGNSNMVFPNISKEVISQVQKCIPGSVFRLNPQCTSACRCRSGVAEIIQCSAGLAYDSKTDKCVLAHLARC